MNNVWKIAPGPKAGLWPESRDAGCITISWLNKTNLLRFRTRQEVHAALARVGDGGSRDATSIWQFVHGIQVGDVVVANDGQSRIEGMGIVLSDYLSPTHPKNPNIYPPYHRQARLVDWRIVAPMDFSRLIFNKPTVQRLSEERCSVIRKSYAKMHPKLLKTIDRLFSEQSPLPIDLDADEGDSDEPKYIPTKEDLRQSVIRQIKERRGQQKFRQSLQDRYGNACMVTGCSILEIVEAAHVKSYRGQPDHNPQNGLLLRADIHTLFDLDLLGIDPETLRVVLSPLLRSDSAYAAYHDQALQVTSTSQPSAAALKLRWKHFQKACKKHQK